MKAINVTVTKSEQVSLDPKELMRMLRDKMIGDVILRDGEVFSWQRSGHSDYDYLPHYDQEDGLKTLIAAFSRIQGELK